MIAIRGAITINENSVMQIKHATEELFQSILDSNDIDINNIISIIFSCTQDITREYPGKFLREKYNLKNVGIMHFNEMKVENSLDFCIRVMVIVNNSNEQTSVKHIYLGNAKNLRKDLINSDIIDRKL